MTSLSVGQEMNGQHNGVSLVNEKVVPDRWNQERQSVLPRYNSESYHLNNGGDF